MRTRRTQTLGDEARAAVTRLLSDPIFEVIPIRGVERQIGHLPGGAMVSVTASPAVGIAATIDLAVDLHRRGHRVVPHLAARMFRDRTELEGVLGRLGGAGITRVFVIGGDAGQAGDFPDALSLLQAMDALGTGLEGIGIACYPDGHSTISDDSLLAALRAKSRYATWMASQVVFDPGTIIAWLLQQRRNQAGLPIRLGIPGATHLSRLIRVSAQIGVGRSARYISRNTTLAGRLGRPGGYTPDGLVDGLSAVLTDPACVVEGFHIFTFNQVEETEAWRRRYLDQLTT